MDTLGSLVPYDAAGIYLIESVVPENGETEYVSKSKAIRGYQLSFEMGEPSLKVGEGFIGYVAQSRKPLISATCGRIPDIFKPEIDEIRDGPRRLFPTKK